MPLNWAFHGFPPGSPWTLDLIFPDHSSCSYSPSDPALVSIAGAAMAHKDHWPVSSWCSCYFVVLRDGRSPAGLLYLFLPTSIPAKLDLPRPKEAFHLSAFRGSSIPQCPFLLLLSGESSSRHFLAFSLLVACPLGSGITEASTPTLSSSTLFFLPQ